MTPNLPIVINHYHIWWNINPRLVFSILSLLLDLDKVKIIEDIYTCFFQFVVPILSGLIERFPCLIDKRENVTYIAQNWTVKMSGIWKMNSKKNGQSEKDECLSQK